MRSETAYRGSRHPVTWNTSFVEGLARFWKLDIPADYSIGQSVLQFQSGPMSEVLVKQHPLQRLSSPSRGFSALVHVCLLVPWFW